MEKRINGKNIGQKSKSWMRLDNAAKIYPAAKNRNWTALFRLSAEFTEKIDVAALEEAQKNVLTRFPHYAQRLKKGLFWYYLEQNDGMPAVTEDVGNPCVRMNLCENKRFMFRVRYYDKRIAVEIFHVLADGTGGLCFLKTLAAEYLKIRYGADIPRGNGILDCTEPPKKSDIEDAYLKYARKTTNSRTEKKAYYIKGTDEPIDVVHITTGIIPVEDVLEKAKCAGVTLNEYLTAVMIAVIDKMQREEKKGKFFHGLKPIKINVPVDLRKFYDTNTLRNFALFVNPGIDPRYGEYRFEEILKIVHCYMGLEATEKMLNAKFSANVNNEKIKLLRITPLFIKNAIMKMLYIVWGDRQTSTTISNLGRVELPEEMAKYVTRMDFILGPLLKNRDVCAALSYNGTLYLNFTRTIAEPTLEREFFRYLVKQGIHVKIESNQTY